MIGLGGARDREWCAGVEQAQRPGNRWTKISEFILSASNINVCLYIIHSKYTQESRHTNTSREKNENTQIIHILKPKYKHCHEVPKDAQQEGCNGPGSRVMAHCLIEGVRLEWMIFIGIFENLEKKNAKYNVMQKRDNNLKIL